MTTTRAYDPDPTVLRAAYPPLGAACGMMGCIMIGFALILFPFVVLGFILAMERVEEPLDLLPNEREIEQFLDTANKAELDTFVREGSESALRRFRDRLGIGRRNSRRRRAEPAADAARALDSPRL